MNDEQEVRALAARLLAGCGEQADEDGLVRDPELAAELQQRLDACGVRLVRVEGEAPRCVVDEAGDDLGELSLALLATCALKLRPGGSRRARIDVDELWLQLGKPAGYSLAYLRRAGLGPLEVRGLIRVVKPAQRSSEAYVVAGPALAAIPAGQLEQRLRALSAA